jgi:hypothetical protein
MTGGPRLTLSAVAALTLVGVVGAAHPASHKIVVCPAAVSTVRESPTPISTACALARKTGVMTR